MGTMSDDENRTWVDRYMLRLPDGMRDRIKAAAAENNRSMNAEIVATLEEKYPAPLDTNLDWDWVTKRSADILIEMRSIVQAHKEGTLSFTEVDQRFAALEVEHEALFRNYEAKLAVKPST